MEIPTGEDESDYLFQSDRDLSARQRRKQKANFDAGEAVQLKGKAIDLLVDGDKLYVATSSFDAVCIDLKTRTVLPVTFTGHKGPVTCLALLGSSSLVTGSWDKRVGIWNKENGALLQYLSGHSDFVKSVAVVGKRILSGSSDKSIRAWNSETGECLAVLREFRRPVECLLPLDGRLYCGSSDGSISEWDLENLSGPPLRVYSHHATTVYTMDVTEDGATLVTSSADRTAQAVSLSTGELELTLPHADWVRCALVRSGHVFTGSKDESVRQFSLSSGALEHTFDGHFDEVTCLAFYDGVLISAAIDCTVRFWPVSGAAKAAAQAKLEKAQAASGPPPIVLSAEEEAELAALMEDD